MRSKADRIRCSVSPYTPAEETGSPSMAMVNTDVNPVISKIRMTGSDGFLISIDPPAACARLKAMTNTDSPVESTKSRCVRSSVT